jgi:O-antigen/teichoic acid export membrane protein
VGIVQRQSLRNTVITYAGIVLGFVNSVLLFPRFLGPNELGLVNLFPFLAVLYAQVASVGSPGTILRYFPYFRDRRRAHHGFLFMVLSVTFAGFLAATLVFLLLEPAVTRVYSGSSVLLVDYYRYLIPLALIMLWHLLLENYAAALFKTVIPSLARSIIIRLANTAAIVLFAAGWLDFRSFLILFILNNLAAVVVLLAYLGYLRQLRLRPRWSFRLRMLSRRMLLYGAGVLFTNVNSTGYRMVDSMMLAAFVDLSAVGVYTTMVFVLETMLVPWRSMYKVVYPLIAQHWKNRAVDRIAELYKQVSIINILFGGFVFMLIVVNLDSILSLLPPRFEAGRNVVFILGASRMFDLATGINSAIVLTSRYYIFTALFLAALTGLSVVLNLWLIPLYGLNGAALATALAVFTLNLLQILFVAWKFRMQPFSVRTIVGVLVVGGVMVLGSLLPRLGFMPLDVFVRSVVCSAVFWVLVLRLRVSEDVREYLERNLDRVGLGGVVRFLG